MCGLLCCCHVGVFVMCLVVLLSRCVVVALHVVVWCCCFVEFYVFPILSASFV